MNIYSALSILLAVLFFVLGNLVNKRKAGLPHYQKAKIKDDDNTEYDKTYLKLLFLFSIIFFSVGVILLFKESNIRSFLVLFVLFIGFTLTIFIFLRLQKNCQTSSENIDCFLASVPGLEDNALPPYILNEALRWYNYAASILSKNHLNIDGYVMLIYCIELLIKCILLKNGTNIYDDKCKIHDLKKLFLKLPENVKVSLTKRIEIRSIELPADSIYPTKLLTTFDDYLDEVSFGFIKLRYCYEKYDKGQEIFIPSKFITDFAKEMCYATASEINIPLKRIPSRKNNSISTL